MTIPKSIWAGEDSLVMLSDAELIHIECSTDKYEELNIEYVLKSNPPLDKEPSRKCGFTGGRENTPFAEIVPCNYYRAEPGEVSLEITGRLSCATLEWVLHWFKKQTIEKTNAGGETYRVFGGVDK